MFKTTLYLTTCPKPTHLSSKGLAGKKTLHGEVCIKGAKNAILKAMATSILFEEEIKLENVSDTADVEKMKDLLRGSWRVGRYFFRRAPRRALGRELGLGNRGTARRKKVLAGALSIDSFKAFFNRSRSRHLAKHAFIHCCHRSYACTLRQSIISHRPEVASSVSGPLTFLLIITKKWAQTSSRRTAMFNITASKGGSEARRYFLSGCRAVTGTETLMMAASFGKREPRRCGIAQWNQKYRVLLNG